MYFRLLSIIIIAASLLVIGQAAEWWGDYRDKKFPGKCVITPSIILNSGVRIKDPNHDCRQIVCGLNGLALVQGCGVHTLSPPCYFGDYVNLDLDYPMCCERMVLCD